MARRDPRGKMLSGYKRIQYGIIKQHPLLPMITYDVRYISDSYDLYASTRPMSELRLNLISGVVPIRPGSEILDVGYGNGDFLRLCMERGFKVYGNDVSGYPLPPGAAFVADICADRFDCVTFFDSIEHMVSIDFMSELLAKYVVISLPWCHYLDDEWFRDWKHRRPDEHVYHFDAASLCLFMNAHGFSVQYIGNPEDRIRTPVDALPNILTGIFRNERLADLDVPRS
jgi:SAM-dependent methyltransferase